MSRTEVWTGYGQAQSLGAGARFQIWIADTEIGKHQAFSVFHALRGRIGVVPKSYQMEHAMYCEMRKVVAQGQAPLARFPLGRLEPDRDVTELRVRFVR